MIGALTFPFPPNPAQLCSSGKLAVVLQIFPNEFLKLSFNQFVGYIEKKLWHYMPSPLFVASCRGIFKERM
jgi:hypothetical protein